MCIDYCELNSVTVQNSYSLSKIQDCLDMIETVTYFSKIDLTSEYWQINVKEKDCLKTAFNTHSDKYEFCVMLFELTNASATFQEIMNDILHLYLDKFVVVYLDNILIYSNFREEHLEHVQKVLALLKKHKLYAKLFKCAFLQQAIEFCDHIVGQGSVWMNMAKVKTILKWSPLQTVHDVWSFLGLCAYYCWFIKDFAQLTEPLYELLQDSNSHKHKIVQLNYAVRTALSNLKHIMTGSTVLAQSDVIKSFVIETDTSDFEWEAVLM